MRHVDALAHALVHTFGITKGDRVGIAMRNLPEWIVSFAAIVSVGAVSVSFNAWWTESEMDYAIERLRASRCWSPIRSGPSGPTGRPAPGASP